MSDGTTSSRVFNPSQNVQDDDRVFQFSNLSTQCNICFQPLSPEQDRPTHWLACSHRQRTHLKLAPTVYQHAQYLAESDFQRLKTLHDATEVAQEAQNILWMLQGMEALGEYDYRGLLESLRETGGYADTQLKRSIVDTMTDVMSRNGSILSTILAFEDALHYNGLNGLLRPNDLTSNVMLLPYWKTYEIDFLKARCSVGASLAAVYREYSNLPRVKSDALPGRGPLGVAVWTFKLKKTGNAI